MKTLKYPTFPAGVSHPVLFLSQTPSNAVSLYLSICVKELINGPVKIELIAATSGRIAGEAFVRIGCVLVLRSSGL